MSLVSQIRYIRALDSAATDGSGKTGIAFGSFTAKYLVEGGTLTALTPETITTLGTYQAPSDAVHIRIKELSSSAPTQGVYEVHFHNTQVAVAGKRLWLFLSATGAAIQPLELDLITTAALPSANAGADGGLPVLSSSGTTLAYTVTTVVNVSGNLGGDVQGKVLGGGASSFTAVGVQADAQKWAGQTTLLDANNLPKVNVTDWNGTVAPALPTNFTSLVIDSSGRVDLSKWAGTALAGAIPPDVVFIRSGTAQAGGTSSITLDSGASSVNNYYQNAIVLIRSGTGAGQSALITSYVGSSKVATINGNWATVPDNTSVFSLLPFGLISATVSGNVTVGGYAAGQDPATYILATPAQKLVTTAAGRVDVGLWLGQVAAIDANNLPQVAVKDWNGVAVGALPANFAALGITSSGHITNVDTIANVVPLPTVDGKTAQQAWQYIAAMVAGKLPSGAGSGIESYLGLDGATTRVTMVIDSLGNRTSVSYN